MIISLNAGRFVAQSNYEDKDVLKAAGFRWDPERRQWYTEKVEVAARLAKYANASCRETLAGIAEKRQATIAASHAASADISIPAPAGQQYLPFQRAGIAYAMQHTNVLIADEMGLGKTIQALGVINADEGINNVLIICPASLRLNWQREAEKWLVRPMVTHVVTGAGPVPSGAEMVIVNYDRLTNSTLDSLMSRQFDLIIIDEAHYCKNPKALRTKHVLGAWDKATRKRVDGLIHRARRRLFLTGTPILNRPIELHPIAASLAPHEFGNMMAFAKRYCNATEGRWGWDFSGASHLDELQERLRATIMVRRLKADVLTELPAKRRQVIELPANGAAGAIAAEREAWDTHEAKIATARNDADLAHAAGDADGYKAAVARLNDATRAAFTEIARLRHETAIAKIPQVLEHIDDVIESVGKLVVFGHHHDVIDAIAAHYPDAVVVTGETPLEKRQANVDRFQSDPTCRIFIGNIQAAGVGITLTAASTVVFAELDWVPANISQAEDRCHRIGQRDSVLVQHLVLDGSLDARMAKTLVAKQSISDAALDDKAEPATVITDDEPLTPGADPTPRPRKYPVVTANERERVSAALRFLAGLDEDHAGLRNRVGFNKLDSTIGHKLAGIAASDLTDGQVWLGAKLVTKYARQLS